jgi:hypothetical protein
MTPNSNTASLSNTKTATDLSMAVFYRIASVLPLWLDAGTTKNFCHDRTRFERQPAWPTSGVLGERR